MTDYKAQANDFLKRSGTSIAFRKTGCVQGFPFGDDNYMHNRYSVKLTRNGKLYEFPFYDSYSNYLKGERPTPYDVLACLEPYNYCSDMWDFANEFGYKIDSKESYEKVKKTFEAVQLQAQKLQELFEPEWLDELLKIR